MKEQYLSCELNIGCYRRSGEKKAFAYNVYISKVCLKNDLI